MNDKRIETKFLINTFETEKYIKIIKSLPFRIKRKYETRQVNNLYLDTFRNQSLSNHLDGLNKRYKCRIRWYGNFEEFLNPKLEFKIKINQAITKKKFNLPITNNKSFFSSKDNLFKSLKDFAKNNQFVSFAKIFKITRIISYERDYYESLIHNIRFTVDKKIQYKTWKKNKVKIDSSRKILQRNFNIIEVKYDYKLKFLLPIIIQSLNLRPQSYSKFVDYRY